MKVRFQRVVVFAKDVEKLSEWYVASLGLSIRFEDRKTGWIELDAGGGTILAFHKGGAPGSGGRPPKLGFSVSDLEEARAELGARGVKLGKIVVWKHNRYCDGRDPEGNPFQIFQKEAR